MAEGTETPTAAGATSAAANGSSSTTTADGGAAPLPPAVKIDVTEIATPFREEVRRAIRERYGGVGPKLVAFLANTVRWRGVGWMDRIHTYILAGGRFGRLVDRSTHPTCIYIQQDPYAKQYAEWTGKACEADGIRYELRIISANELEEQLYEANADPDVHGVLIYYPVFGTIFLGQAGRACGVGGLTEQND